MTMSSLNSNGLQSPDLCPIELFWDMEEWEIHIILSHIIEYDMKNECFNVVTV